VNAPDTEPTPADAQFWDKYQLAAWLGVKVSYVEAKARSREWPSYRFSEIKFSPEQRQEILAKHERKAKKPSDDATDMVTVDEAAKMLRISRATAYRRVATGELPVVNVAPKGAPRAKCRIPIKVVHDLINQRPVNAA
jgi:excisionase family DNA binding protein